MAAQARVGVAAVIHNGKDQVVMGQRKGSHGAGTWALPGGHLEFGESFADCAKREVVEETGLSVSNFRVLAVTNDVMEAEKKHYVTVFVYCSIDEGKSQEPQPMEPEKCEKWFWKNWEEIRQLAQIQEKSDKTKLFLPIINLFKEYPCISLRGD